MIKEENSLPKNKKHIAFYGFRGGPGGLSHVMLNLMNAISRAGWDVDILLHKTDIPELVNLDHAVSKVALGNRWAPARLLSLIKYLRAVQPVAILVNREPANRQATLAKLLSGSQVKLVVRVGMAISSALERRGPVKRFLRSVALAFCYRRADLVIANAQRVADDIVDATGVSGERLRVLDNPTVSDEMFDQSMVPSGHPWLDSEGPPVILGVGRLVRQKDFKTLIGAFARVRQSRQCRLVIIGEGKDRDDLLAYAAQLGVAEDLYMPGFQANPFAFMKRAAVFALSSAWEGSPNVLIQAMALGTPSVSTDCPGGSHDILGEGRYGPLVPVGDDAALANGIVQCLDKPLGPQVLQTAVARFRADMCARA
jgi:glycosyltransferase involved in cell wall biosynthesis